MKKKQRSLVPREPFLLRLMTAPCAHTPPRGDLFSHLESQMWEWVELKKIKISRDVDISLRDGKMECTKSVPQGHVLLQIPKEHCVMSKTFIEEATTPDFVMAFFHQIEEMVSLMVSSHDYFIYFVRCAFPRVGNAPYMYSRVFETSGAVRALHEMLGVFIERGPLSPTTLCRVLSELVSIALSVAANVYDGGGKKVWRGIIPIAHRIRQAPNLASSNAMCVVRGDGVVAVAATRDIREGEEVLLCHLEVDPETEEGRDIWALCHGKK